MGELEEGANRGQDEAQARMLAEQVSFKILVAIVLTFSLIT